MQKVPILLENLIRAADKDRLKIREDEERFKVNLITSSVALIYEKLRNIIDYNEEHLLRKNAINRILRRRFIERTNITKVAEIVIKELISAGYLKNEAVPERMKFTVAEILTKYHLLFEEIQDRKGFFKGAVKLYDWLISLAAVEIEEILVPAHQEKVYLNFLYDEMRKRFEVEYDDIAPEDEELYLYLATYRSLIKSDRSMLNYFLFKLYYPHWKDRYEELIPYLAEHIESFREQLEGPIDHPLVNRLIKKVGRYSTMVNILKEVIESEEDLAQLKDRAHVEERIKEVTLDRYKTVRRKTKTAMTRAVVYVFLTKMLIALAIEVPLDAYFYGEIHTLSVVINVTVPVLLLILIAVFTRMPGQKNTAAMVEGIMEMLSVEPVTVEKIKPPKKRSLFTRGLFNSIYVIAYLIPFYLIILFLDNLNFSILSMAIFLTFISIVSFFGVRVRIQANDLRVLKKKDTLRSELFDFFATPIIRFGRWLSLNFSKINVFALFLDVFIEAPLKIFLQILDEWFGFVKEKKDYS